MARRTEGWSEVEALLNRQDERRYPRRKLHHLPEEFYTTRSAVYCVTLCARHQGQPFLRAVVADPTIGALRYYRQRRLWTVYAFCLMPDHLHAVVRLGEEAPLPLFRSDDDTTPPPDGLKKLVSNSFRSGSRLRGDVMALFAAPALHNSCERPGASGQRCLPPADVVHHPQRPLDLARAAGGVPASGPFIVEHRHP